jgi:5-methylcytosine-specific restriction endonuclease McrA
MNTQSRTLRSKRQRYQIWKSQGGICAICGEPMIGKYEIDHVVPARLGINTAYYNLQAVHPTCNRKKGGYHVEVR